MTKTKTQKKGTEDRHELLERPWLDLPTGGIMDNPYIGRIVVLLSPLIAGLSLFIVNSVQDLVGVELDGDELTVLLTAAVGGAFLVVYRWLVNRGNYEQQVNGK